MALCSFNSIIQNSRYITTSARLVCFRRDGSFALMDGPAMILQSELLNQDISLYTCWASFYHHKAEVKIQVEVTSEDEHLGKLVLHSETCFLKNIWSYHHALVYWFQYAWLISLCLCVAVLIALISMSSASAIFLIFIITLCVCWWVAFLHRWQVAAR